MKHHEMVSLGDYIEYCDERNKKNIYSLESVRGISIEKKMIFTKANMAGVSLTPYKLFKPNEFCFVPVTSRNGNKMTISMNYEDNTYIVSSAYEVFRVKDSSILLPDYLFLLFLRPEFDRYARFHSWGSARESFSWDEMCRVMIPLPSIDEQQKVVNAWKALREIKEQNEAIAAPLMQMCQSYIQELMHEYDDVEIGKYITYSDNRNNGMFCIKDVKGVSIEKKFIETKANMDGVNVSSYKLVYPNYFCFVPITSRNGGKITMALNNSLSTYLVSTSYEVFYINDETQILPEFMQMWFSRTEFDRYARFHSWGSAREAFSFEDMKRVKIPLPPIEKQRAIVNVYNCANEAKRIAAEADRMSREVCPALIQHVIHN